MFAAAAVNIILLAKYRILLEAHDKYYLKVATSFESFPRQPLKYLLIIHLWVWIVGFERMKNVSESYK